ncbi:MAG: hypothetical protein JXB42_02180 [Deltaproteobacteria bacterium]|nr:hypothetical protein [Deltaproteobacteria bacterium]
MKKWGFCITIIFCVFIFFACSQPVETGHLVVTSSATLVAQNTLEPGIDPLMATIDAVNTQNSLLTPSKEINSTEDAMLESIYAAGTQQALATKTPIPSVTSTRKPTPTPTPYGGQNVWLAFYGSPMDDHAVLNDWFSDEIYIYAGDLFSEEFVPVARVNALPEGFQWTGTSLAWANDGSKIAFVDADEEGYVRLNMVDIATGTQSELVTLWRKDFEISQLEWDKTESIYLAFYIYRQGYRGLYLLNSETLEFKEIIVGGISRFYGWLEGGTSFVYSDTDAVYEYNAATKTPKRLFRKPDRSQYMIDDEVINLSGWGGPNDYLPETKQFLYHGSTKQTTQSGIQSGYFLVNAEDNYYATWLPYKDPEGFENRTGRDMLFSDDGKWVFVAGYDGGLVFDVDKSEVSMISNNTRIRPQTVWLLDWYSDLSALIVADVRNYCKQMDYQIDNLAIRILDTSTKEVLYNHLFTYDQGYLPILKTCNNDKQKGMTLDTVFVNSDMHFPIHKPMFTQEITETEFVSVELTPTITPTIETSEATLYTLGYDLDNLRISKGNIALIANQYLQLQEIINSQFPLVTNVEGQPSDLTCVITNFNYYQKLEEAPTFNGKYILVDFECAYLDINYKEQVVYLPLDVYDPETQKDMTISWFHTATMEEIEEGIKDASYETMFTSRHKSLPGLTISPYYLNSVEFDLGTVMSISTINPKEITQNEKKYGHNIFFLGYQWMISSESPLSETDLESFRMTGDPIYLPEINGKHYFWPCRQYIASPFNLFGD